MFIKNSKIYLLGLTSVLFFSLFFSKITFAHVTLLQPVGGEVLEGNSDFTIKWEVEAEELAPDQNFDIRFSRNNGASWDVVVANLLFTAQQFDWSVPNINTSQGLIEVIQDLPEGEEDEGARSGPFTINKVTDDGAGPKSFSFNCEDDFNKWILGLEKLIMSLGHEQSCTLKLTNLEPGVSVEISTNLRTGRLASIEVSPIRDIADENGELEFTIIAINEGIDWVSWAVSNSKGKFKFTKKAYDDGTAWGMFVEVK